MWFRALPLLWRLATVAGIVLALAGTVGGIYLKIRHDAYQDGYSDAAAKCEAEKRAMEEANKKAIAEAEKKLAEAIKEIELKEATLDDYIMLLDREADEEPVSGDACLSHSSVRRLSAIQ
jgi:hypothetical protein